MCMLMLMYIKVVRLLAYFAIHFFIVFSFTSILHFKAHAVTHELTSAGEGRQFSYLDLQYMINMVSIYPIDGKRPTY